MRHIIRIHKVITSFLSICLLLLLANVGSVSAAPVVGFNPGYIISDNVFTSANTMSAGQIQAFLLSKVPVCDTWGTGGTTPTSRRDYIRSMGYDVPLRCLIDYTENGKSAAQIIYDVAQEFQINPQVLIVLLQKEQGLVTDDWPGDWQYKTATGYGCPDTAVCDTQYFGFTNQLRWSARMYRSIMNASPTWYTPYLVGDNYIRYNPNASCGGTVVNIQNRATQALYNYTPYQPNPSALNAGYGAGDSCGAYGNRNFYLYFTDWFGSTHSQFIGFQEPRWMRAKADVYKTTVSTLSATGNLVAANEQVYFDTKILLQGVPYFRSMQDTANGVYEGVLGSQFDEIQYEPMNQPRWLKVKVSTNKQNPRSGRVLDGVISSGTQIYFTSKMVIQNVVLLRSQHDASLGLDRTIPISALEELSYEPLSTSRWLQVDRQTTNKNIDTGEDVGALIQTGDQLLFTTKVLVNNRWYLRTSSDTAQGLRQGIPIEDLGSISYRTMDVPRHMKLATQQQKVDPITGAELPGILEAGRSIYFSTKVYVNGSWYLRSAFDTTNDTSYAIPLDNLQDI